MEIFIQSCISSIVLISGVGQGGLTGFRRHGSAQIIFKQGGTDMGDKGKKDKGKVGHK